MKLYGNHLSGNCYKPWAMAQLRARPQGPIEGSPEETLRLYWSSLNEDNRISLAVKEISSAGDTSRILIRNKYE